MIERPEHIFQETYRVAVRQFSSDSKEKKNFLIISSKFPAHFLYHAEGGTYPFHCSDGIQNLIRQFSSFSFLNN